MRMDVISLGKAKKVKQVNDRLSGKMGAGPSGAKASVAERVTAIESLDPKSGIIERIGKVSAHTAINLNKHNLQMNSHLNKGKTGHKEMVFDDFSDASGIDMAKSSGVVHDTASKTVKVQGGASRGELVLTKEVSSEMPLLATVTMASNGNLNEEVDLSIENFANNEIVLNKGALYLKKSYQGQNENIALTAVTTASSFVNANYLPEYATNGLLGLNNETKTSWTSAISEQNPWIQSSFGEFKLIKQIRFVQRDTKANGFYYSRIKDFRIHFDGGYYDFIADNTAYVVNSGESLKETHWVDVTLPEGVISSYVRLQVLSKHLVGSADYISIMELEIISEEFEYLKEGSFESGVIDMGDNFKVLSRLQETSLKEGASSIEWFTATSNNGVNFEEYLPLNTDGTIASTSHKFIKVKAVLKADGVLEPRVVHDFTAEEASQFEENEYVTFDGALKLKTEYEQQMVVDETYTGEGTLLKAAIEKNKFKGIQIVGVE